MRWDRFFEDLEGQLGSEWEAERAALDTEAERLRIARLGLRDRLAALAHDADAEVTLDLLDGERRRGRVRAVGADWIGLADADGGRTLVPLAAIAGAGMPHADLLRTTRPAAAPAARALAERMGLGFVLRDLARRRVPVVVRLPGDRLVSGTIDRAGADHADLALHEPGVPRRASEVTGFAIVPFAAILSIRLPDDAG